MTLWDSNFAVCPCIAGIVTSNASADSSVRVFKCCVKRLRLNQVLTFDHPRDCAASRACTFSTGIKSIRTVRHGKAGVTPCLARLMPFDFYLDDRPKLLDDVLPACEDRLFRAFRVNLQIVTLLRPPQRQRSSRDAVNTEIDAGFPVGNSPAA